MCLNQFKKGGHLRLMQSFLFTVLFLAGKAFSAPEERGEDLAREHHVEDFLNRFYSNPAETSRELPPRISEDGRVVPRPTPAEISAAPIREGRALRPVRPLPAPGAAEFPREILRMPVERQREVNREAIGHFMEEDSPQIIPLDQARDEKLESMELAESPWSDSYWPYYQGGLSARYADPAFYQYREGRFRDMKEYVNLQGNRLWDLVETAQGPNDKRLLRLAPAEKYDLLLGDQSSTLSTRMWQLAEEQADENGDIESWIGLCHGWAAASYREKRPMRPVQVSARDSKKTTITFYPSDIKALTSLLWSTGLVPARSLGNRCNDRDPKVDDFDRILAPNCFDIDPAEWHISLTQQMGRKKKTFIIDATYDYEVWNHPILSYRFAYFNPVTKQTTTTLEEAVADRAAFTDDPFKAYRSDAARYVVGIVLDLTYVSETAPDHGNDYPGRDARMTLRYLYDLELDEARQPIRGEWYQQAHPDFIWQPESKAQAVARGERRLGSEWSGREVPPEEYADFAVNRGASYMAQPIGKIVRRLIDLSRGSSQ